MDTFDLRGLEGLNSYMNESNLRERYPDDNSSEYIQVELIVHKSPICLLQMWKSQKQNPPALKESSAQGLFLLFLL